MALKRYLPIAIVAVIAGFVVWAFAAVVLVHTPHMGLPLDDSYIYLTYAKQIGRAQPFTYYSGGGYSAGATSALWPVILAPFWTLGARGHALVWVAYLLCGALYIGVGLGVYTLVRRIASCAPVGVASGVLAISIAPFAFAALSGMEVALASALLVAILVLLLDRPANEPPGWKLAAVLAAASLSRPEAMLLVGGICAFGAIATWRAHGLRMALRWLVPLAAPIAWLTANKLFAGHWFPNTGVVKSHFYLPGFDWTYWWTTVHAQLKAMFHALFWSSDSPLEWPRTVTVVALVGAVRAIVWSIRAKRLLVGLVAIAAPLSLLAAVIATSAVGNGVTVTAYTFQNYRYVATAFPLVFVLVGFALAPPAGRGKPYFAGAACCAAAAFFYATWTPMKADMLLFAQGAVDTNTQVVAIGHYLHAKLPGARVMLHDAGAIAYYGDGPVYDMLGLVTNDQAEVANNGPGSRFELLERLPADQRPAYFAYYPSWLGTAEFFGEPVLHTQVVVGFATKQRLVGDLDMQLIPAVWDHVGTGEAPLLEHAGWAVADAIDVADIASEHAHHWKGELGRRHFGDPTAKWSFVERAVMDVGLVLDGGRTIRAGGETFELDVDPAKPVRLVIRTGGAPGVPFQEAIGKVSLDVFADERRIGAIELPPPNGPFNELSIDLPAGTHRVRTQSATPYRVFHWFALQPSSP